MGLNPEFDQVRIQILGKSKVPSFNEVVAIVRSEESRRTLMLDTPSVESSAMVAENTKNGQAKVEKKEICGVLTVISHNILGRSAGNYMENLPSREWT